MPAWGNADDERRVAALNDEPVETLVSHRASLSTHGRGTAPRITTAPERTSAVAASMSGENGGRRPDREPAAQQRAHSFERRARQRARWKSQPWRQRAIRCRASSSVVRHRHETPRSVRGHRDMVFLIGRGRDESTLAGWRALVFGDEGRRRHLRDHEAGVEPRLRRQERGQARQRRSTSMAIRRSAIEPISQSASAIISAAKATGSA